MEWHWFKQQSHIPEDRAKTEALIRFFTERGYKVKGAWFGKDLEGKDWTKDWGNDVYWIKKGFQFE